MTALHSHTAASAAVPNVETIRLSKSCDIGPDLKVELAECLSDAFSCGLWATAPMPVGAPEDPHSALGVLHGLGRNAIAVHARTDGSREMAGCVVGTVMDDDAAAAYGVREYGARAGDALLAFVGVRPEWQGRRVSCGEDTEMNLIDDAEGGVGLARRLFESWMAHPTVRRSRSVFIRTRRRLPAIQHLSASCGFEYCGQFPMEFRGERQNRLVYRLDSDCPKIGRRVAV